MSHRAKAGLTQLMIKRVFLWSIQNFDLKSLKDQKT